MHTSPAVAGNKLYIGLQDWRVLALDRRTGTTRWEFKMQNPVAGSAAVAQGMVYIGSLDGFLYALDAATGKRIWQFKTQDQPLSPPAIAAGSLFLSSTDGSLYALHARTGLTWLPLSHPGASAGRTGRRQRAGLLSLWRPDIRRSRRCA